MVAKEKSLKQMVATVRKDKKMIEDTIEQLDEHKKDAMEKTWTKVNRFHPHHFHSFLFLSPRHLSILVCFATIWSIYVLTFIVR